MPPRRYTERLTSPRASTSRTSPLNPQWDSKRLGCLAALLLSLATANGHAQAPASPTPSVSSLARDDGPAQVLDALARRKDPAAVRALSDFIRQGQPDALTDRALEVLG